MQRVSRGNGLRRRSIILVNGNLQIRCCKKCLGRQRDRLFVVSRGGFLTGSTILFLFLVLVSLLSGLPKHMFLPMNQSAFLQGHARSARPSLARTSFVRRLGLCALFLLLPFRAIFCSLCLCEVFSLFAPSLELLCFCFLIGWRLSLVRISMRRASTYLPCLLLHDLEPLVLSPPSCFVDVELAASCTST